MNVKKCDRCGTIYVPDETNCFQEALLNLKYAICRETDVRLLSLHLLKETDLCDDCIIKFESWWKQV